MVFDSFSFGSLKKTGMAVQAVQAVQAPMGHFSVARTYEDAVERLGYGDSTLLGIVLGGADVDGRLVTSEEVRHLARLIGGTAPGAVGRSHVELLDISCGVHAS